MIFMKRIIKWLKSPAGIGVGTTVLAFILTVCYDLVKTKPVLPTILSILLNIWKLILWLLNFQLRVWWVLLGIVGVFFILYILFKVDEMKHSKTNLPPFMKYTKDKILNWKWEWDWEKQYDGKYGIGNLHPICPRCNTPLICNYERGGTIECPRCHHSERSNIPDIDTVKTLITDNVRKGLIPKGENDK